VAGRHLWKLTEIEKNEKEIHRDGSDRRDKRNSMNLKCLFESTSKFVES